MRRPVPFFVCLALCTSTVAEESDVAAEAKSLVRRMEAARRQLRSGVVEIRGTRSIFNPEKPERCRDVPVEADCAFDWQAGKLRYDTRVVEPTVFYSGADVREAEDLAELMKEGDSQMVTNHLQTVRTPELFAYYEKMTSEQRVECDTGVEIFESTTNAGAPVLGQSYCFDVRSAGLFNYWEFDSQPYVMGYGFPENHWHICDLDTIVSHLAEWPATDVERRNGLTTIRYLGDLVITLDEARGCTPRYYFDERGDSDPDFVSEKLTSTVDWKQIGDVWVPTDFMIELRDFGIEGRLSRHTYTLNWSRVNQPIPEHYFDFRDFADVQDGTAVYDSRSGDAIQAGTWQNGSFVPLPSPDTAAPDALAELPPRRWSRLLLINGVVLTLVLTAWLLSRRYRRTSE